LSFGRLHHSISLVSAKIAEGHLNVEALHHPLKLPELWPQRRLMSHPLDWLVVLTSDAAASDKAGLSVVRKE